MSDGLPVAFNDWTLNAYPLSVEKFEIFIHKLTVLKAKVPNELVTVNMRPIPQPSEASDVLLQSTSTTK